MEGVKRTLSHFRVVATGSGCALVQLQPLTGGSGPQPGLTNCIWLGGREWEVGGSFSGGLKSLMDCKGVCDQLTGEGSASGQSEGHPFAGHLFFFLTILSIFSLPSMFSSFTVIIEVCRFSFISRDSVCLLNLKISLFNPF